MIKEINMERLTKGIIIGVIIGLILGGVVGYFIRGSLNRGPDMRNFQITDATKNEITSFFDSTSDLNEINSYCQQNRMYCAYYCRDINPNHEICTQLQNFSRPGRQ